MIGSAKLIDNLYLFKDEESKNKEGFSSSCPYQASKPFFLIHSDIWGPSRINTNSEKKKFVTFINDHTRLCWVYLMKEKSKVESLFKIFYSMIKNLFQTKIGILHTDMEPNILRKSLEFFSKKKVFTIKLLM